MQREIASTEQAKEANRQRRLLIIFPSKDTKIERMMQDELSNRGYAYYKHYSIIGQPDIVFPEKKIAIFCDGDYVHGNPNEYKPEDKVGFRFLAKDKWKYDKQITEALQAEGWLVLRFWEHEIKENVKLCVDKIENILTRRRGLF
jgi:DNA mismatch endonuclease Vsr